MSENRTFSTNITYIAVVKEYALTHMHPIPKMFIYVKKCGFALQS